MLELELLGSPRLKMSGDWAGLRAGGLLLAYLALVSPRAADRRDCAKALYPGESYEVAGNRIRVALSRFKTESEALIHADGSTLRLGTDDLRVDIFDARRAIQNSKDELDEQEERLLLMNLLPTLGLELLPSVDASWVLVHREEWRKNCISSLVRLCDLASEKHDWDTVSRASVARLFHFPDDVDSWQVYLRACSYQGDLDRGLRELRRAKIREDSGLSEASYAGLLDFGQGLRRTAGEAGLGWSNVDLMNLGSLMAAAIDDSPADVAEFLAHPSVRRAYYANAGAYTSVLERVLSSDSVTGENEFAIRMLLANSAGARYDREGVLKHTGEILKADVGPGLHASALFLRSFAHFQGRDYISALADIRAAEKLYESAGLAAQVWNARGEEALYWWQQGEFERGLKLYEDVRNYLETNEHPTLRANNAIRWANEANAWAYSGDIDKAYQSLDGCFAELEKYPNENLLAMLYPMGGYILVCKFELARGTDLLVDGLKRSCRRSSYREMQIGIEWAAGALCELGAMDMSVALLDWVRAWRESTGHTYTVAEQIFVDRVLAKCETVRVKKIPADENARRVIAHVISRLRQAQAHDSA